MIMGSFPNLHCEVGPLVGGYDGWGSVSVDQVLCKLLYDDTGQSSAGRKCKPTPRISVYSCENKLALQYANGPTQSTSH